MASVSQALVTNLLRRLSDRPAFRIYGKAKYESDWHVIDVFANSRRNCESPWPLWRGHCITLSQGVIAVGWDFAESLCSELAQFPVSQKQPVCVIGGSLRDSARRQKAGGDVWYSNRELLAHECGHTGQARRFGFLYWPTGATVTLFREGPRWWQRFENQASETGLFGGIVPGTLHPRLQGL